MLGPICWEMQGVFVLKIVNQQAEHICIVESGESDLKKKIKKQRRTAAAMTTTSVAGDH